VRIARSTHLGHLGYQLSGDLGQTPGIYPYLGAAVGLDGLRAAVANCGSAAVPGRAGARLAGKVRGRSLVDPAVYGPGDKTQGLPQDSLWPCDEWLDRQRAAGVPLLLTDSPRIAKGDRPALRRALQRWDSVDEPVLVVLPIETWWLRAGLPCLTEEVRAAGRPVGLILMHHYNALDTAGSIAGLLAFISAVGGQLPVVLPRCDISAIGAVTHGAFAGFVGMSARLRHGPMPIRITREADGEPREQDQTPAVLVPALHDYYKGSRLPAFARAGQDLLRCDYSCCRGTSLLEVGRLCEVNIAAARKRAYSHNIAVHEEIAREVLGAAEPTDAWWERCKAGADTAAALIEFGISLPVSRWLRQWLELGSPSHDPVMIG
jgi:hypothetical protein